jgi:hypothetical protein
VRHDSRRGALVKIRVAPRRWGRNVLCRCVQHQQCHVYA